MQNLFPDKDKVFAGWFNGEIKIPEGKMLHYEHQRYLSIFENDLFLQFEKGLLISQREVDNTKTFDPEDPYSLNKVYRALLKKRLKVLDKDKHYDSEENLSDV